VLWRLPLATALVVCAALTGCSESERVAVRVPPEPRGTVLWAVGDGGTGSQAARDVSALLADAPAARVIYLGDVYEHGTREDFDENFDAVYGDLVKRMWPTPGNHEWGHRREGYDAYWRGVRRGRPLRHWYERRIAGWQVLSLNSEGGLADAPRQLRWLRARLRGRSTCRIAFWHRPRFSAGRNGDQQDVAPLWEAVRGRVPIVLAGHDHDLQRLKPIDGTVTFVSGAGGRHRYAVDERDPRLAFADDKHFGALRIELRRLRAVLTFVAADGAMLDRSTVSCRR
jgi:acid phosphatase type 7